MLACTYTHTYRKGMRLDSLATHTHTHKHAQANTHEHVGPTLRQPATSKTSKHGDRREPFNLT